MNTGITMLLTAEPMERLFDLDLQLLFDSILTLIAVFVLFLVASYYLFNPVRNFMNQRTNKVSGDLEQAAKDKEDAATLKAQYEAKLKEVDKEVDQILADARKKAVANESKIIEEARKEAAAIIQRAETEAELEKKRVANEVKQEMVNIASLMAGKVVADKLDTTIQDSLIEETLKEIGDHTWLS